MPRATESREEIGRRVTGRIKIAQEVYRRALPNWKVLEDSLAGQFPPLIPGLPSDLKSVSWTLSDSEQINLNMNLRTATYMTSLTYDEMPSMRFSRVPGDEAQAFDEAAKLGEMILDEGEAMQECRKAIRYMLTRGVFGVWLHVNRISSGHGEIEASRVPPDEWVMAARLGQLKELPDGLDFYAISTVAREALETPSISLGMSPTEQARVAALAEGAEAAHARMLAGKHRPETRAKIMFQATPYGSWMLWDPSVTDHRYAGWMARKIVQDYDEFLSDPSYTDEAKDAVKPVELKTNDPAFLALSGPKDDVSALEETGRVSVWEVWDRRTWQRHYVAEGYEGTIEKDSRYPYLDGEGQPMFADFYPCVVRVPIKHNREVPEQAFGVPFLAPGWAAQCELIRTRSAWYTACKRGGRVGTISEQVDPKFIKALTDGGDGIWVPKPPGYDPKVGGPLVEILNTGVPPVEYLNASIRLMSDYANMVGVSMGALTGEPVADTLGQEQIALKGSTTTQADVVRELESATAELARKALILFKYKASDADFTAYLGVAASQKQMPNGMPLMAAVRGLVMDGHRLTARFASSTRADDLASNAQLMNYIALAAGPMGRDSTGVPYRDVKTLLLMMEKRLDIDGVPDYQMTDQERLVAVLQKVMATQTGAGMNNGSTGQNAGEGGGDKTSRLAGGQRGEQPMPGRQERGRAPVTGSQLTGVAMRPANAR